MEENHLEYGYLEGESIGGHFAEDPVGVTVLYILVANARRGGKRGCRHVFFVCAHVSSASKKATTVTSASASSSNSSYVVVASPCSRLLYGAALHG